MEIVDNFIAIKSQLPDNVKIIAVSKTKPIEDILQLYNYGHKIFGENKVQELVAKYEQLPKDIQWHLIGHLQTNKVKYVVPFVYMIQSVDSLKLMKEIEKRASKIQRKINILFEMHIAQEQTKFGFTFEQLDKLLKEGLHKNFKFLNYCGLMGMATFTDDTAQIEKEFKAIKEFFDYLKTQYFSDYPDFKELSIGMSNDYLIAVKYGATMVRIGTKIFGKRT